MNARNNVPYRTIQEKIIYFPQICAEINVKGAKKPQTKRNVFDYSINTNIQI